MSKPDAKRRYRRRRSLRLHGVQIMSGGKCIRVLGLNESMRMESCGTKFFILNHGGHPMALMVPAGEWE